MNHYNTLIFDGNNILYRAFYSKQPMTIVGEVDTTSVKKLLQMIKSAVNQYRPSKIMFTWDKKLNPTKPNFRKELVPYKMHRPDNSQVKDLHDSITHVQKFLDALGIETIYPVNLEADDVIRYMSLVSEGPTLIISSDKDLLQLVSDKVHVLMPSKNMIVTLENFTEVTQVRPEQYITYKAIVGDLSDNIKGLNRYGPVKAKTMVNDPDYMSKLSDEQIKIIHTNFAVMDLKEVDTHCPDEYSFYEKQHIEFNGKFDTEKLKHLFTEYHLPMYLAGFGEWNNLFNMNKNELDVLSFIIM
jgi:DNA polymerase-1